MLRVGTDIFCPEYIQVFWRKLKCLHDQAGAACVGVPIGSGERCQSPLTVKLAIEVGVRVAEREDIEILKDDQGPVFGQIHADAGRCEDDAAISTPTRLTPLP